MWLAMTVLPALAVGFAQSRPAQAIGPVAYVSSQRISSETADGKAGIARLQALQRERTTDARTKQQALEATRRQLAAAEGDERVRLRGWSNNSGPSSNGRWHRRRPTSRPCNGRSRAN